MTRSLIVLFTLALSAPLQAQTIKKWAVKEFLLCATVNYPDWQAYQAVRVTGTFTHTNGTVLTVNGFWDGKGPCGTLPSFRVRFTPHFEGTWNYSITNNMNDNGLTGSGQLFVDPPAPSPAGRTPLGFLRRDAPAGSAVASYIWGTGAHAYLWGQTYYQIVNREASGDASWKTAVDKSTGAWFNSSNYNMNKIRILISPHTTDGGIDTQPYKQVNNVMNKDQLNIPHWQALDRIVQYLNDRNIVAEIVIFRDPNTGTGEAIMGTPTQDCRYLRYSASRYAAYPNVAWSLSNEWENANTSQSYWNDLGCVIKGCAQSTCTGSDFSTPADPWFTASGKYRVLTIHPAAEFPQGNYQYCFEFAGAQWPSAASLQSHKRQPDINNPSYFGDQRGYESIACNQFNVGTCPLPPSPLPVSNDEYGYLGIAQQSVVEHRNTIWGIATGGGYGTAGDARTSTPPIRFTNWAGATEYDDIKRLVNFFTSTTRPIEYWKMRPLTACQANTRVHTLAEIGKQYITYTATGNSFTVPNLTVPAQYQRTWFDPRGTTPDPDSSQCVTLSSATFTPPNSTHDWVLLLQKTTSCP
jgi:Domain of unknown function (DUF5060)/Protein of unknown function (DUF4038)/Putative collagen-binding domain of a collagenase